VLSQILSLPVGVLEPAGISVSFGFEMSGRHSKLLDLAWNAGNPGFLPKKTSQNAKSISRVRDSF